MVDTPACDLGGSPAVNCSAGGEQPVADIDRKPTLGPASSRPRKTLLLLAVILAAGATLAFGQSGGARSSQASPGTNAARAHTIEKKPGLHVPTPTATTRPIFASKLTTTTTAPAPSTPALAL